MGLSACTCGIGRCCGVNMSIHWTFWFNFVFQILFGVLQYTTSWKYILLIATVWGPALLLALVVHEMGHIGATRCQYGGYLTYSMLWPLGGFNDCTVPKGNCGQELFIALSGPLMHVPLMFLWTIVLAISADEGVNYYGDVGFDIRRLDNGGADEWFSQLAKRSLDVNIMIFCLNMLLPAYPLDAARMVAAICGHFGMSIEGISWVLIFVGALLGTLSFVLGIFYMIQGDGPGVLLFFLGLYVSYTSFQMYRHVQSGSIHLHPLFQPDCFHKERRVNRGRASISPERNKEKSIRTASPSPRGSSAPPSPRRSTASPKRLSKKLPTTPSRRASSPSPRKSTISSSRRASSPSPRRKSASASPRRASSPSPRTTSSSPRRSVASPSPRRASKKKANPHPPPPPLFNPSNRPNSGAEANIKKPLPRRGGQRKKASVNDIEMGIGNDSRTTRTADSTKKPAPRPKKHRPSSGK